jgi:6-phosphogluconolactonase (cycloisomerase 2 family)
VTTSHQQWPLWGALALVAAAAVALLVFVLTPSDEATSGALTQLPGREGCVSETGSGGACARVRALRTPVEVVVSPDGKHAYVASQSAVAGGVAVFDRAADGGALTQKRGRAGCLSDGGRVPGCARANAIKAPVDLAISPDGRHVYVAALTSDAIAVLARDPATGILTQRRGRAGCVGTRPPCAVMRGMDAPLSVRVSPDGRNVYAYSYESREIVALDRDPRSGRLTRIRGSAGCTRADLGLLQCGRRLFAFDQGLSLSADAKHAYEVNSEALLTYDRDEDSDTFRVKSGASGCFGTSEVSDCTPADAIEGTTDVALSPDGRNVYVAATDSVSLAIFDRDADGTLTQKARPKGCVSNETGSRCATGRGFTNPISTPFSATVSPDGRNVYATTGEAVTVFDRR